MYLYLDIGRDHINNIHHQDPMKYQYSNQNYSWKLHRACSGSNMSNQGPRYGIDKFRQKNKQID